MMPRETLPCQKRIKGDDSYYGWSVIHIFIEMKYMTVLLKLKVKRMLVHNSRLLELI